MFRSLLKGLLIITFALTLSNQMAYSKPIIDVPVVNEYGVVGNLKSHLESESLLVMGFYNCKHICDFVVRNLSKTLSQGKKYPKVIFFGIDENEGPRDALRLKKRFFGPERDRWTFLTSDKRHIDKLASALPFEMKRDPATDAITHEIGFFMIKDGKILKKISSIDITPKDLVFSNDTPSFVEHVKKFCSEFDPTKSKYGVMILRALTLTGILFLVIALVWFRSLRREIS